MKWKILFLFLWLAVSGSLLAFQKPGDEILPNFDIRSAGIRSARLPAAPASPASLQSLETLEQDAGRPLSVRWSPLAGTPTFIVNPKGALTPPVARVKDLHAHAAGGLLPDPAPAALSFIKKYRGLWNLSEREIKDFTLERRYRSPRFESTHVVFEHTVGGLPVFLEDVRVNFDGDGRIINVAAHLTGNLPAAEPARLSAAEAAALAARSIGADWQPAGPSLASGSALAERVLRLDRGTAFQSDVLAELVIFPMNGRSRPAWHISLEPIAQPAWYQILIDASTGELLFRGNLYQYVETFGRVFKEHPDKTPQSLEIFPDRVVHPVPESPDGWVTGNETLGNNVDSKEDLAADNETTIGRRGQTTGVNPLVFDYPFQNLPSADTLAAVTNLFYVNNIMHDWLYRRGFDEAAGNFQADNFGKGGLGNDYVYADAQDGAVSNNANFGTPPDGMNPRMQMGIFTGPNPDRDTCFDADVVMHEFCHGLSNRLVGGPSNTSCLWGTESGAMGEGWSDFFACSYFNDPIVGEYVTENPVTGIRRASYENYPYTYGDLCNAGCEVHNDGEIWAATLWDARKYFRDTVFPGDMASADCAIEFLVIEAMKLSPCDPTMLDMRDSILLADSILNAGQYTCALWQVFAAHGMGDGAVTDGNGNVVESLNPPGDCTAANCNIPQAPVVLVDATTNNQVLLSWAAVPGAVSYRIFRGEQGCGTTCDPAPFEAIATTSNTSYLDSPLSGGQSYYYKVTALSNALCSSMGSCRVTWVLGPCLHPPEYPAGSAGINRASAVPDGQCRIDIAWNQAVPGCPDAVPPGIRYNIYRSLTSGFTPGPANWIASVDAPALSYTDRTGLDGGFRFYYVVRAEDTLSTGAGPHGGNEEKNAVELSAVPLGLPNGTRNFLDPIDPPGPDPEWTKTVEGNITNDWAVVNDGNSGGSYAWHANAVEGGNAAKNLIMPPLSLTAGSVLTFRHTFQFEVDYDGGVIEISLDGGNTWTDLMNDIQTGGYNGRTLTVQNLIHAPNTDQLWNGEPAAGFPNFETVTVNLAPYAGAVNPLIRFRFMVDPLTVAPGGWYIDDVAVTGVQVFDRCQGTPIPLLQTVSHQVSDANPLDGNGNGRPEPGEAVELWVTLTNSGSLDATGVWARVSTTTPLVTMLQDTSTYPDLASFAANTAPNNVPYKFYIDPAFPCPGLIRFQIEMHTGSDSFPSGFDVQGGQMLYPFKDDFEQDLGWQTAITQTGSGPQSGTWERGVPVGTNYQPGGGNPNGSGGACYATELAATTDGSNDVDDIETTLTSPAVDLAGVQSAKLVYYRWYARNNVPGSGADPFRVEVSNDGFATSTLVEEIVTGTGGWQRFEYDIPQALLTADFRIRYTISDLPNDNIVEAAVDDVSIEVPQCEVFGETPQQCAQAIRAIRQLVALKEGNDIRFDWASELHARGGYRLYSVTDSTGIPNAHAGNPAAALAGETVGVTSTSVVEAGSVPGSPGDIRYYQVVGVCPGGSPEGPN